MDTDDEKMDRVLAGVGGRLAALRKEHGTTLAALSRSTGISTSTLSRLESGHRRATLELLLPIARAHGVSLDDLVGTRPPDDPRVRRGEPIRAGDTLFWPLTNAPVQPRPYLIRFPAGRNDLSTRTHEGHEWIYVLSGRLRLLLGEQDLVLGVGEAAEFDTRVPHGFGTFDDPVEALGLFGRQGERAHLRARVR